MNSFYRQVNALLLCAAMFTITPAYSMEIEVVEPVEIAQIEIENTSPVLSTVWYKKRSIQMAMVLTTVAATYAFLVSKDKVVSPLAFASALFTSFAATSVEASDSNDNIIQDNKISQNDIDVISSTDKTIDNVIQNTDSQFTELVKSMSNFFVKCKDNATTITEKDLQDMNDTLNR